MKGIGVLKDINFIRTHEVKLRFSSDMLGGGGGVGFDMRPKYIVWEVR